VTNNGLNGLTKCTYFINVAADKGAPAFSITNLDYWKFQLHYAEWSSEDMVNKFLVTNPYVGTIPPTAANIYPIPVKGNYPANSGPAMTTLNWPTEAQNRANWFPNTLFAGDVGPFQYYRLAAGSPWTDTTVITNSAIFIS
jgi:hypothetical protein